MMQGYEGSERAADSLARLMQIGASYRMSPSRLQSQMGHSRAPAQVSAPQTNSSYLHDMTHDESALETSKPKFQMRSQDLLQLSARNLYHLSGGFRNGPLSENGSISDLSAEESGPSAACSDCDAHYSSAVATNA